MTASSIDAANASRYEPRTLPAIFARTTGNAASVRGLGALPEAVFEPENRPSSMPTRLPPDIGTSTYQIGVGDVLVLATPQGGSTIAELSGLLAAQNRRQGYTVQDDGAIAIPDVGRVDVSGLTLEEAEGQVFVALVNSGIEPAFSLEIAEFNSKRVTVGGRVARPAVVPITLTPLRLAEALNAVGGLKVDDADYGTIRLYRDGKLYQIPVSLYLSDPAIGKTVLTDGDSLYVDSEFDLTRAQAYFEQQIRLQTTRLDARESALDQLATEVGLRRAELDEARMNFVRQIEFDAVDRDYVYIAGEVGQQSRYTLPFDRTASLADALFDKGEGVPNATGNIGEVYVLRGTGDGRGIKAWHLDAYNAANLVLATRFELRPDDVVFVSEKPLTALSRVIGQIGASILGVTQVGAAIAAVVP